MTDSPDEKEGLLPQRQDSFYLSVHEDDDLQPHELSGDENAEKSVISSEIANSGKASKIFPYFRLFAHSYNHNENGNRCRDHIITLFYKQVRLCLRTSCLLSSLSS